MICVKNPVTWEETVVGFYHQNSIDSHTRVSYADVVALRSQQDILNLLGNNEAYRDIWDNARKVVTGRIMWLDFLTNSPTYDRCQSAMLLKKADVDFWRPLQNLFIVDEGNLTINSFASNLMQGSRKESDDAEPIREWCGKKIIGYYTSWGKRFIDDRHAVRLTHVIFAFIEMLGDGSVQVGSADRKVW